ncbi:hypothetical protein PVAP13_6NG232703 [Panicum virgatum]|uniref:Uncharacterized protein n=1 Tax=Panicum virgatum TaxID=38727 RepID=A0A8T0QW79_PANVG|nr:hypothetical protein PVAP13_6NG232703 [Panicum virgatum]
MPLKVSCSDSIQGSKPSSSNLLNATSALTIHAIIRSRLLCLLKMNPGQQRLGHRRGRRQLGVSAVGGSLAYPWLY